MEQKLAEFRARRRAEMEADKSAQNERRELQTEPLVDTDTSDSPAEPQKKAEKTEKLKEKVVLTVHCSPQHRLRTQFIV